jgi:hypothetical protein
VRIASATTPLNVADEVKPTRSDPVSPRAAPPWPPSPLAVSIGQQFNPTTYQPIQLYPYRHKEMPTYKPSIRLGP